MCSHYGPKHFSPWSWLVCRILASGSSRVSRVSSIRVRFSLRSGLGTDAVRGGDALLPNYIEEDLFLQVV